MRPEHLLADIHLCHLLATERLVRQTSSTALPAQKRPEQTKQCRRAAGRTGKVTEPISAGQSGYVQIDGDMWKAVSQQNIAVGETVRVIGRESTIITVEML